MVVPLDPSPSPGSGRLQSPRLAFLALNPGIAFLGDELWRSTHHIGDMQSRHGVFAREILQAGFVL